MDFFMRKYCFCTNDIRSVNSVSEETWLSQGVVRAESLFPIPVSFVGVLKVTVNTVVTTIPSGSQRDNILKVRW